MNHYAMGNTWARPLEAYNLRYRYLVDSVQPVCAARLHLKGCSAVPGGAGTGFERFAGFGNNEVEGLEGVGVS